MFNHLCIIGATAVAVGVLVLEWKTVLREAVFYLISLVVLLVFLIDSLFCFILFYFVLFVLFVCLFVL